MKLLQSLLVLFIVTLEISNAITTIHHDKPEVARLQSIRFNKTIANSERQKRLLPYMQFYLEHNFNQPIAPPQQPQQQAKITTYQQFHDKFNEVVNGYAQRQPSKPIVVQEEEDEEEVIKPIIKQHSLTPFLDSNALPGPFLPMRHHHQPNYQQYTTTTTTNNKVPNYSAIYDKLSQLKLQQQQYLYNPSASYHPTQLQPSPPPPPLHHHHEQKQVSYIPIREFSSDTYNKPKTISYTTNEQDVEDVEGDEIHSAPPHHQDHVQPITSEEQAQYFQDHKYTNIDVRKRPQYHQQQQQQLLKPFIIIRPKQQQQQTQKLYPVNQDAKYIFIQSPTQKPQTKYTYELVQTPLRYRPQPQLQPQPQPHPHPHPEQNYVPTYTVTPKYEKTKLTLIKLPADDARRYQPISSTPPPPPPQYHLPKYTQLLSNAAPPPTYHQQQQQQQQQENTNSLSLILKKLQETNTLPHTLTPDNIDNSIRTLVKILSSLKKAQQQKFHHHPIIVQDDSSEYEEDNEADRPFVPPQSVMQMHPEDTQEGGTPGTPGVDYPALATIPPTSFSCKTQRYKGFFGDPDTSCQVWHYCDLNGGQASFLCPNGTIFSQVALTCDWWYNVKCSNTPQLYVLNERLYKYILPLAPKFPEDYSGPLVDKYLALKFQEMEEKMKNERKKNKENSSDNETNTSSSEEAEQEAEEEEEEDDADALLSKEKERREQLQQQQQQQEIDTSSMMITSSEET